LRSKSSKRETPPRCGAPRPSELGLPPVAGPSSFRCSMRFLAWAVVSATAGVCWSEAKKVCGDHGALVQRIEAHVHAKLGAVTSADVYDYPFPHLVVEDFLPKEAYAIFTEQAVPTEGRVHVLENDQGVPYKTRHLGLEDLASDSFWESDASKLAPIIEALAGTVVAPHLGRIFRRQFERRFGVDDAD